RFVRRALERVPLRVHQDIVLTPQMLLEPEAAHGAVVLLPARTRYEQRGGGTETSTERRIYFSPEIPGRRVGGTRDARGSPVQVGLPWGGGPTARPPAAPAYPTPPAGAGGGRPPPGRSLPPRAPTPCAGGAPPGGGAAPACARGRPSPRRTARPASSPSTPPR